MLSLGPLAGERDDSKCLHHCSKRLRNTMNDKCQKAGLRLVMPPPILCTDNAALIGSAAFYRLMRGEIAGLDLNACPSLRLV